MTVPAWDCFAFRVYSWTWKINWKINACNSESQGTRCPQEPFPTSLLPAQLACWWEAGSKSRSEERISAIVVACQLKDITTIPLGVMVMHMTFEGSQTQLLKVWSCHLSAVWPWASYSTSVSFSFLTRQVEFRVAIPLGCCQH